MATKSKLRGITPGDKSIRELILVIDDEKRMCDSLSSLLTDSGYEVKAFQDSDEAAREINNANFDLIVSDIRMSEITGLEILKLARQVDPQALVVLMTGFGSLDSAIEAINQGAYDYLLKPVEYPQLELVIKRGLERRRLGRAKSFLLTELQEKNLELSARLEEINALYKSAKSLSSTIDLDELLDNVIGLATEVLHARIGSIMLIDENHEYLTIAASTGLSKDIVRDTSIPIGSSISGYVAKSGEPLFVANVEEDPRFKRENKEERYGKASLLSVPLIIKDRVIGVINMANRTDGGGFGELDLKLLSTFATQAAVAIDNASNFHLLKRRVEELSTLQDITDAMSRAGSVTHLQEIIFWGIRNLMPADVSLWFRWRHKDNSLKFVGGAGNIKVDFELTIETSPDEIKTEKRARKLILKHLPPFEEVSIPSENFCTFFIKNESGLAYVFCLSSSSPEKMSEENKKIAGLIASQATTMYEREKAILNATRLLTMGNMISEISHDMRKPLTNIRGGLQIMRQRWPELAVESDMFKMAEEEVRRLNELVRELVDFSNPKKYQTERINIESILERATQLVSRDMEMKEIKLETRYVENIPEIFANKNQIMEVFLNLIINAIDALDNKGTITILTSHARINDRDMAKIDIIDTGCGIDSKDKVIIFDRYYTSKETGTGLGLAVVERIVSAHSGKIEVDSKKGKGTTFSIFLPIN
ncbi:MAG: GAF domain-containing protein [candidate division Zixibacteria bacterium]